ncbi:HK97 family phage prohead protease [Anaerolactibacter massiliensis]|uniref:HK97 family phage prohead protease n=1 Tax=Anaerolactibacter massiliensis TaxID=2044573 RepID=UPI000CF8530D|nr:HK97 family phage prohead protease [Anaerolactibacter massiliensis]
MEKNDAEARSGRQMRTLETKFETREASDGSEDLHIAGYFAVFDGIYDMGYQMSESIDPHAFDDAISGDVRFLIDHDTRLVLGRTSAHTGELKIDSHGLYGDVTINPKDQDAMNLYARVQRGDVNQCSFGFDILDEDAEIREDGSIHWTIKKVKLYEVSVCTFPAYETTEVSARMNDAKNIRKRELDAWKARMMAKIEGPKGE